MELFELWHTAIASVNGQKAVRQHLRAHAKNSKQNYHLIAIGKAASSMSFGAIEVLGEQIKQALVITKYGHVDPVLASINNMHIIESGHPIPDEQSLLAGKTLIHFIQQTPCERKLLFLISGGASALVEKLPKAYSLSEWQNLNQNFMASGENIAEINDQRKAVSCIKGGKLTQYINQQQQVEALYISDVPGDQLSVIGSGLLYQEQVCQQKSQSIQHTIIASNVIAQARAAQLARQKGYKAYRYSKLLCDDIHLCADRISNKILNGSPGVYIWGGEPTVILPENPGKGGRNQALALLLAERISGRQNIQILVAGTDGSDGPCDAAGGLVDGDTLSKGELKGLNIAEYITGANAYSYLSATDALFQTGPTGTNVMDLVLVKVN